MPSLCFSMPSLSQLKEDALSECSKEPTKPLKISCFIGAMSKFDSHRDDLDESYNYCSSIINEKTENSTFHLVQCAEEHKRNKAVHPIPEFYLYKYYEKKMFSTWLASCLSHGRKEVNKCVARLKSEYDFVAKEYRNLEGMEKDDEKVIAFIRCLKKHKSLFFKEFKGCIS